MIEFRKKQARLKKIMNILVIFSAVYIFIFIGVEPFIQSSAAKTACTYICDGLVIACMVVLFSYFSKYSKSDKFLENIEYELSDAGYYLTSRSENTKTDFYNAVLKDLKLNNFSVRENLTISDMEFNAVFKKGKSFFYVLVDDSVDKNDILAYTDAAVYDITAVDIKRKGNGVVLFICDNAEESAVALSKMLTLIGKKEQIVFATAIAEVDTQRVYFLGNKQTKCQQMIANFVLNCEVPIKEKYIVNEKLPFQYELEEHMKDFNIKDYKNGTFYAH